MTDRILTATDAVTLAEVLRAVRAGAKARWLADDGETIRTGVMRRTCGPDGSVRGPARYPDIRDAHIEITDWSVTYYVPIMELADKLPIGECAFE